MNITSGSFSNGGAIDPKYAMKAINGGKNISPNVRISGAPAGTKSLALAFVDRHPMAGGWVHWLAAGIDPATSDIKEGASLHAMPSGTREMINTFGAKGYGGPQPPRGSGPHRYELTVYALSESPQLREKEYTEKEFLNAISNKVLAKAAIAGIFENR